MTKRNYLIAILFFIGLQLKLEGQMLAGQYHGGGLQGNEQAIFGKKNQSTINHPESLVDFCMWEKNGAIYVFGGRSYRKDTVNPANFNNRMWRYTETSGWELLAGDTTTYTTDATTYPSSNKAWNNLGLGPSPRFGAGYCTAPNGDFYLYGGVGFYGSGVTSQLSVLADLWKFDGQNWTSYCSFSWGVWGDPTCGDPVSMHLPKGRFKPELWVDDQGSINLFGGTVFFFPGNGYTSQINNSFNTLFRWDGSRWNFIYGTINPQKQYSTSNGPGSCFDGSGVFHNGIYYRIGGFIEPANGIKQNALWEWDGQSWSYTNDPIPEDHFYGTKLFVLNNELYLYGLSIWNNFTSNGMSSFSSANFSKRPKLYKKNGNNWELVAQFYNTSPGSDPNNGYKPNTPLAEYHPQCAPIDIAYKPGIVSTGSEIYFYGGKPNFNSDKVYAKLYKFNGDDWALLSDNGVSNKYHLKDSLADANAHPGARDMATGAYSSAFDRFFMFGGQRTASGGTAHCNDLWVYEKQQWLWIGGDSLRRQAGVYGQIGVPAAGNFPGARSKAVSWVDQDGNFWLFGGLGFDEDGNVGVLNDLWKFDYQSKLWTWMNGSTKRNGAAITNSSLQNTPAARSEAVVWTNSQGHTYLFGGYGYAPFSGTKYYNDFWKWDGVQWRHLNGDVLNFNIKANYQASYPGGRSKMVAAGNDEGFFMYGGSGINYYNNNADLAELWYYKEGSNTWTLKHSDFSVHPTSYEKTITLNHSMVKPGVRKHSVAWVDGSKFYVMGGETTDQFYSSFTDNRIWQWDDAASRWAFVQGSFHYITDSITHNINRPNEYAFWNMPGAHSNALAWRDNNGAFHIYSGSIINRNGVYIHTLMADHWSFDKGLTWDGSNTDFEQQSDLNIDCQIVSNQTITANTINCRDLIIDANTNVNLDQITFNITGNFIPLGQITGSPNLNFIGTSTQQIRGSQLSTSGTIRVAENSTLNTNGLVELVTDSLGNFGQIVPEGPVVGELSFQYPFHGGYKQMANVLLSTNALDFGPMVLLPKSSAKDKLKIWDHHSQKWNSKNKSNNLNQAILFIDSIAQQDLKTKGVIVEANQSSSNGARTEMMPAAPKGSQEYAAWQMLYNPFTFTIDLEKVLSSAQINSSFYYLLADGNYAAYNPKGGNSHQGSPLLPPGQVFWMQLPEGQTLAWDVKTAEASAKKPFTKRPQELDGLRLIVRTDSSESIDDVWIGVQAMASEGFDPNWDAWKLSPENNITKLSIITKDGEQALENSPFEEQKTVKLQLEIKNDKPALALEADLNQLKSYQFAYLENPKTGYIHDFKAQPIVSLEGVQRGINEYTLHLGVIKDPSLESAERFVYAYSEGQSYYLRHHYGPDFTATVRILSTDGKLVKSYKWSQNEVLPILSSENSGCYLIQVNSPDLPKANQIFKIIK